MKDRKGRKMGGMVVLIKEIIADLEEENVPQGSRIESTWLELRNEKGAITLLKLLIQRAGADNEADGFLLHCNNSV